MKDRRREFIKLMQKKTAITAIEPSSLRGQKAGTIQKARDFFDSLDLSDFSRLEERAFKRKLDDLTKALLRRIKLPLKSWGVARKAINLFLRDVLHNRYLNEVYHLDKIER